MIHRKLLKVKTKGSKKQGTLEPDVKLPRGINMVVLEYDYKNGTADVELWCSDHELHQFPKSDKDLDQLAEHPNILKKLTKHPKSPKFIGNIAKQKQRGDDSQFEVIETEKKLKDKGKDKTVKFLRKLTRKLDDVELEVYIIDE